jgi:Holliday junction resolvase
MRKNFRNKGYLAEKKARDFFSKYFYVIPKGISTKGVDIVALNNAIIVLCEVKYFGQKVRIDKKQIENLFKEEEKLKKYFSIPILKLVVLVNNKEIKFKIVDEIKNVIITKEEFEKLPDLKYYNLLEYIKV